MKRKINISFIGVLLILLPILAFAQDRSFILLSSTIGPIDSGIVAALEDAFEKETGIRVRHVGAGTGAALNLATKGNVDIVMAHAKSLEEKFVQDGFGTERVDFMYNDFVIVGPASDPAGIRGMKKATKALQVISEKKVPFISRGDKSGTHVAEMELWNKAMIKPQGSWYAIYEKGTEGNVPTLRYTDQKQAYTVIDRATFLSLQKEIKLQVLVENDILLLNFISLLPVNPQKFPRVNHEGVKTFVKWLTDPGKGQKIVEDFGKDKFGSPLFFPNSKEWREAKGMKKQ
ncbi:MAG: ABC-type tungstate transport system, solute-binding protein [Deltaproteobacteria bacterium]|nr:ABC-type tungstate transport system, solute-binding protein [Deltaproteobacteria bacterium]